MNGDSDKRHLTAFFARQYGLDSAVSEQLIDEVCSFYRQTPEQFVRDRHQQLQRAGKPNAEIYQLLARELEQRLFASPTLSDRQIRRIIYG